MDKYDKKPADNNNDYSLRKDEIIQGHDSYLRILQNSISISTDFLKVFIEKKSLDSDSMSPLFTGKVKVGFIIAKKKIRKAVLRNRIRRLLKESYRLNKNFFITLPFNLNIIFSLSEKGYMHFMNNPKTKLIFISEEMKKLQSNIKNYFNL
jgi:ribonuclease P protein component